MNHFVVAEYFYIKTKVVFRIKTITFILENFPAEVENTSRINEAYYTILYYRVSQKKV